MKVLIVLFLAVASTCAFNLRSAAERWINMEPVVPVLDSGSRITNGQTAAAGQFPYQVGLYLEVSAQEAYFCGGCLISTTWVLTAAHCTDGMSKIYVYLGSTTILSGTVVVANQTIIHDDWNANTLANDISLLSIPAVTLGTYINIIPLPAESTSYSTYLGEAAFASGWGKTSDSGSTATNLQYAAMTIASNTVCSNTYGTSVVKDSNICVATPTYVSTCSGDSGGPLALSSTPSVLIGVTSFGAAAGCVKGYPIAFTRITSYRTWIKQKCGV